MSRSLPPLKGKGQNNNIVGYQLTEKRDENVVARIAGKMIDKSGKGPIKGRFSAFVVGNPNSTDCALYGGFEQSVTVNGTKYDNGMLTPKITFGDGTTLDESFSYTFSIIGDTRIKLCMMQAFQYLVRLPELKGTRFGTALDAKLEAFARAYNNEGMKHFVSIKSETVDLQEWFTKDDKIANVMFTAAFELSHMRLNPTHQEAVKRMPGLVAFLRDNLQFTARFQKAMDMKFTGYYDLIFNSEKKSSLSPKEITDRLGNFAQNYKSPEYMMSEKDILQKEMTDFQKLQAEYSQMTLDPNAAGNMFLNHMGSRASTNQVALGLARVGKDLVGIRSKSWDSEFEANSTMFEDKVKSLGPLTAKVVVENGKHKPKEVFVSPALKAQVDLLRTATPSGSRSFSQYATLGDIAANRIKQAAQLKKEAEELVHLKKEAEELEYEKIVWELRQRLNALRESVPAASQAEHATLDEIRDKIAIAVQS